MSDFSSDEFLQNRPYWNLLQPSAIFDNAYPFTFHISGDLFKSITSNRVIRISNDNSILILEHDTFNTITSSLEGGCVHFSHGHSFYHKHYSNTKAHYGAIGISHTSENINYNSIDLFINSSEFINIPPYLEFPIKDTLTLRS